MKILDASATAAALPFDRLVPALQALFAQGCEVPARHVHEVAVPGGTTFTSLIMPAWIPGRYYGVKTINIAPANAARGLPGLHASYLLYDGTTGVPLALLDGDAITHRRTAAASALAARWLAREDAAHLLVVGAGQIARLLPAAYRAVRPIAQVSVWARDAAKARALAADLQRQGMPATAVSDLQAACAQADIVSCATLATEPIVQGAWLRPGTHLDLIGSFTPAMREADDACFAGASLYVDTEEALKKSGELLGPMARGVIAPSDVRGTLATLSRGESPGRTSAGERTVFKSVGTALEDLAAAVLVHETTRATP
ncbi:ornithine cyclodeaminase family protein [Ramlibacter sp. USB13]|uniref:Ornithine cyclodeaminase family protein n=1 Tax=Ramlibacter cellulosilyticus TaxID=2764187 RepID=A0A923MMH5_9BURK|nr:ornithine cyclodeaminase family protein [Ramlibacter cellulosilyticus]MBC5781351.1 ornithine cyclodeaminase family protein [Ramlibacter cellulosilyticus]